MENLNMHGTCVPVSAYGLADGRLDLHIQGGVAPYRIELKVNDTNPINKWEPPFYRTIEDIPAATTPEEFNCIISDLPPGGYKFRIYDSSLPEPQVNLAFTTWNATSPPYATLNGNVNPLGKDTTVSFEYGLTTTYEYVAQFGIVNGNDTLLCSLNLSSGSYNNTSVLLPGKLYHYRIKATNSTGVAYGADMTFVTPDALPIVETLAATNIK